jgi:protein tyrosine phosphatase
VKDFWRMISEKNVKLVLSVCKLNEKGKQKCEQWWPTFGIEDNEFQDMMYSVPEITVKAIGEK